MVDKTAGMTTEAIANIWREVLHVEQIKSEDNFLDLGGSSLHAGEVAWRISNELLMEVTVDAVLSEETFGSFVRSVLERQAAASTSVPPERAPAAKI